MCAVFASTPAMAPSSPKGLFLRTLARGLLQIFYPNICWLCRDPIGSEEKALCQNCRRDLFTDPRPSCPRCAATVGPFAAQESGCLACHNEGFAFDRAFRLGPYAGLLRDVVLRLKHAHAEGLAEIVAGEWATAVCENLKPLGIHCVMPIPLHWWRRWQRGCNQSDALARAFAQSLSVPWHPYGLRRLRTTQKQANLTSAERRENMRGAFEARRPVQLAGKTILLVDDVMTTGSTCHDAARRCARPGRRKSSSRCWHGPRHKSDHIVVGTLRVPLKR